MAYRYQKINPQSTALPITLSTSGTNGVFEFNIGANTTFNLSKSLLNISTRVTNVIARFVCSTAVLSQIINRIQLVNSKNEILCDINDAYSYSTNTMLNCNSGSNVGILATQRLILSSQALADNNTYYNISKTSVIERLGSDTAASAILNPILYVGNPFPVVGPGDTFTFNTWAAELSFMYPKTIFSLDKNIHTKEALRILITINPVDLFHYMGITVSPASSFLKNNSIPEGTAFITTFNINLYIVPNEDKNTDFTVHTIEPEIQKLLIVSQTIHNPRIMLKPKKGIGFIAYSPYSSSTAFGVGTGSNMFGNSLLGIRDGTAVGAILNYDLRLSGNPIVQSTPVSVASGEYLIVNRFHYAKGYHQTGISINTVSTLGFVDYTTFDGRSIYDFDPNDTSYLESDIPLELTNDVVISSSVTKQHQFVIGYRKTLKSENGFLSVVI